MRRLSAAIAVLAALAAPLAQAQSYPSKSLRIIVPYVPGGTVDLVGRVLAQLLAQQMGQQVIVENKAGASGMIGSDAVAKSQPDGYTLLVQSATLVAGPLMVKNVPYDVLRDLTPISQLGSVPMVMTANPAVPGSNLREFIAAARARPNAFNFGIPAAGSPMHLAGEAIKHSAKLDITVVTYRGTGAAITDLLGGQIQVMIDAIPSSAGHIASGKMKPLAVTTATRLPSMPNVPTVAESGLPGFEMVSWYGLWGPAKLPPEITNRLATEVAKAMHSPVVAERLGSQSFVPAGTSPSDFTAFITKEIATYTRVVHDAHIHID